MNTLHDASGISDLLEVKDVVVHYGRYLALRNVSISIAPGETLGLVGESGSGKSTLGRAVLGLAQVSSGSIRYLGREISQLGRAGRKQLSREIQVVFQDPYTSLNAMLTVGDILVEPLLVQGISGVEARRRVQELLDQVRLPSDAASRLPREFSGGQRQRIAIARALAINPQLIVCDEPVSALDLSTQARVLDLFIEIQERTGVAYLFITHDLAVVRAISHRVAVMNKGEIVEQGPADLVTSTPRQHYTKRLLAAAPVPDPVAQAERRRERLALEG
ncbi:ABC transporter ATP-binding protein [Kaistia sp. 32K]|uniref:ATP-binding cassette domain-containing protein n=1 Tax=Kaistia sp. 32K TaxID=2795690 RepID=UPI00193720B6|nr:ATP-binding cassette domain-containing protein [Kaistia sp. 32K]BCP52364.1 ABC transporter ATP-binding protein [Kaistia sp. 32K]